MSAETAARRHRAQRALSATLDGMYGPDRAEVVYTFEDGWTVRRLTRLDDQLREGELMRNCLRAVTQVDPNCFSLRDEANVPHASFAGWRADVTDPFFHQPNARKLFLITPSAVMIANGRALSPLKREYRERLERFGASDTTTRLERFPTDDAGRRRAMINAIDPGSTMSGFTAAW
jgi:hypothetical protein